MLWASLQPAGCQLVVWVKLLSLQELLLLQADLWDLLVVFDLNCLIIEMAVRSLSILVLVIITGVDIMLHNVSHSIGCGDNRAAGSWQPSIDKSLLLQATPLAMYLGVCKCLIARFGAISHVKQWKFYLWRRYHHMISHLVLINCLNIVLMYQIFGKRGFLQVALCSTFATIELAPWPAATCHHHIVSGMAISRTLELLEVGSRGSVMLVLIELFDLLVL